MFLAHKSQVKTLGSRGDLFWFTPVDWLGDLANSSFSNGQISSGGGRLNLCVFSRRFQSYSSFVKFIFTSGDDRRFRPVGQFFDAGQILGQSDQRGQGGLGVQVYFAGILFESFKVES